MVNMKKAMIALGVIAAVVVFAAAIRVVQNNTDRDIWDDVLDGPI